MRNAIMTWAVNRRLEKSEKLEFRMWSADMLQEERIVRTYLAEDYMEDIGPKTQDGRKEVSIR